MRRLFLFAGVSLVVASCATSPPAAAPGTGQAVAAPPASTTAARTTGPPPTQASTTSSTAAPSTTVGSSSQEELQPAAERQAITLGFAGDTSFTHDLDERDPLGDITAELSAPDLMVVNLETTVAESDVGTRVDKTYTFKSPPRSVDLLVDAGIDAVQLANNHTLDFQRPALLRTLELLDAGDVAYAGAGPDPDAAYAPRFLQVKDWTIGLVAFSRVPCDWSASGENTRPEVAWTCDPFVVDAMASVEAAAAASDLVVVMVHWGIERDHCPQSYQRDLAEAWAAIGADLVIGGHPHVLQGVERIGDTWLVNSTGNFAFPSAREASARSAMFEFTVTEDDVSLRAIPLRITGGRPHPATGDDAAAILQDLSRWSFGWDFDDDGVAMVTDAESACG
jgi:poly-gamma-glutamate synthesis protein (capsule biosynthesis protein)